MEFSNTYRFSAQASVLEIWVTCVGGHGAYSAMSNGNNSNQYACRALSNIITIPTGSGELVNISVILQEESSVRLKHNIPTNSSSGEVCYFDEDDYVGVYWVSSVVGGYSGTVKITPKRSSCINSGL